MTTGHIYKTIDLVGTSEAGVSEAVQAAISRAAQTVNGLDWFEVGNIRGRIENGRAVEFQVAVKIGFRVMTPEELQAE
jgi:dodecin